MRRISHWKYLVTDRIAAFTVLAMNESLQLRQKDFIMRLDELKQVIEAKWSLLDDTQIQKSIGQWKQRLRVVTREAGGSIKHLFA